MVLARALRVLSLAAATTALAQEPQSSPSPSPSASPSIEGASAPGATPLATATTTPSPTPVPLSPDEPPLGPDELRIRANRQEGGQGKLHYEGFVDLRFGQLRIQADTLDMLDEPKVDGASAQRIEGISVPFSGVVIT